MHKIINFIRQIVYLLFASVVRIFGGYSNFNSVFRIAKFTGFIRRYVGYVGGASRRDYLDAIAVSFPDNSPEEHCRILGDYWKEHQREFLELFMYSSMTSENISQLAVLQGKENLDAALSAGKGAVLPVPHFGNVRLLHYALALYGYPLSVVSSGYTDDPEIVRKYKLGETSKVQDVGFRGDNPKWVLEALQANNLIQIASTAEASNTGVEVEFMKRRLFLTSGWVRFAMLAEAPILPTYMVRGKDDRHTIVVEPPFPIVKGKSKPETIAKTAQAFFEHIEAVYRAYPGQIDWMSWQNRIREAKEHFEDKRKKDERKEGK